MAPMRASAGEGSSQAAERKAASGEAGAESSVAQPGGGGEGEVSAEGPPAILRTSGCFLMLRANSARGKVRGALPRNPTNGTHPETQGPLSLQPQLPERSSPSRVRSAAPKAGAPLTACGPF